MEEHCALCPSSLFYYSHSKSEPTAQERHEMFHQPCSGCFLTKSQEEFMCDFCQHLRLRHLVRCVKPEIRMRFLFPLRKTLGEVNIVTKCPLCRILNHMFVVGLSAEQLSELKRTNHDIIPYLLLGPSQGSQSGPSNVPLAEIWVSYSDGCVTSNIWVGDLHIDDIEQGSAVSPVKEMISWARLKDKMSECYKGHSECQDGAEGCLPKGFRVIDVIRRCLVETSDCHFVALSYVWGANVSSSLLTATRATIDNMKKEGGLPASGMPRTIEDAITVCIQLGQRYLWADRLCITQDDKEDKKNQIEAMKDIYSSAQIVLIAAYGDNMDFGIPGVGHPRKAVQAIEDMLGFRITNVIREVEDDPLTLWHTRGWTYQEAVMSRRRLYFTNTRAFFECERSMCHEDQSNGEESRNEILSIRLTIPEDKSRFQSFVRHLRHYSSRKLTYQSDAYNAIHGISKWLYNGTDTFIYGLPRVDFDRALLWLPDVGANPIMRLEAQGTVLPTWSWSSIMGLSDQIRYQETDFYGTLAPWYHVYDPPPSGRVGAVNIRPDSYADGDWQVYMAIACREGCVENVSLPFSLTTDSFSTVRKTFNALWKDYYVFCKEAMPLTISVTGLPLAKQGIITHGTKPGVIVTRCQTAFLGLTPKSSMYDVDIINSEGERIGRICGDAAKLREQVTSPGYDKSISFEFIALSLSGETSGYSHEKTTAKNYFDDDGNSLANVPIVNVLMIGWEGIFARRREIGWIYLVDWVKLRREWKIVMLE